MAEEIEKSIEQLGVIISNDDIPSTEEIDEIKAGVQSVLEAIEHFEIIIERDQDRPDHLRKARETMARAGITLALRKLVNKKFVEDLT